MKWFLFYSTIVIFVSLSGCSEKLRESSIPQASKDAFAKKYPGITGKWEMEDNDYEINFKLEGKIMSAVINKNGTVIETESEIDMNSLPSKAQEYVKAGFPGKKIKEIAKIEKTDGVIEYEVAVSGKNLLFGMNGDLIKTPGD